MIKLQYESKFDGFLVDLRVCPAEELNQAMFGGEPVFTDKAGAMISADTLPDNEILDNTGHACESGGA